MAGTAGVVPLVFVAADAGRSVLGAAGAEVVGGKVVDDGIDGQEGALLSAASDVPLVLVNGGTPAGGWLIAFFAACEGAGPSLIFTYKYAPTTARIVIVMSGRIEAIDRPP